MISCLLLALCICAPTLTCLFKPPAKQSNMACGFRLSLRDYPQV